MMLCDAPEKICTTCKESKLLIEFTKRSDSKDGLSYYCKLCINQRDRKFKTENPESVAKAQAKYRDANREILRARVAETDRKNKGVRVARLVKYRVAKINRTPAWANNDAIKQIYIECAKRRTQGENVVVDHIIPLQGKIVSGLHVAENLRIICAKENSLKSNRFDPDHVHS